jgi:hypothetical protein
LILPGLKPPQSHRLGIDSAQTRHRLRSAEPPQGYPKAPTRLHQSHLELCSQRALGWFGVVPGELGTAAPQLDQHSSGAAGPDRFGRSLAPPPERRELFSWGRSRAGSGFARGNGSVDTAGFCQSQMALHRGLRWLQATLGRFLWNGRNSVPGCPPKPPRGGSRKNEEGRRQKGPGRPPKAG